MLSFDEISLKSYVCYQSCSTDEIIGPEDYGDGDKINCIATSAIMFMARGIADTWKQPLAYYLVQHESCSCEKVTIDKVETKGEVAAVVSDIGSNFQKLIRETGITTDKPWFIHKERKIVYLLDPLHIIEAIRYNLINCYFKYKSKTASWQDMVVLDQIDSKNSIRCCPKLTSKHISPNGFQKMKVKYAIQVLSHTVSAALLMAASGGLLSPCATGTAEAISTFDQTLTPLTVQLLSVKSQ